MVELESVGAYLVGRDPRAVTMFRRFEDIVTSCGPCDAAPRKSIVYWKRARVFVGAYIERDRLELNIDLLRHAEHPCLLAAFNTTKRVITHRLRISDDQQLDEELAALVREAYETVGPGTRGLS